MTSAPPAFDSVAVFGLGTIGSALTASLLRTGARVTAVEADEASLARGREAVRQAAGEAAEQVTYTLDPDAVAGSGLVIEAVTEDLALKAAVLRRAGEVCGPATILATTTALSVTQVAAETGRLPRTIGLHPVGHAPDGGVVEVVATPVTDPEVRERTAELVAQLGRTAVDSTDLPGFTGGGLLMAYLAGAVAMLERRYASRDDIDAAMTLGCGLPLGPLAHLDLIGLDTALDTLRGLHRLTGERRFLPPPLLTHMVTAGLLGVKSGRGFYSYPADAPGRPVAASPGLGEPRPVRQVGIVGSGTMARGIAEVFARSGYATVLTARSEVKAKEAVAGVGRSLDRGVSRGKLSAEVAATALDRLVPADDFGALADCDLLIEAVAEELPVKRQIFGALDKACRPDAVLSTTTSSLPVVECAMATRRPGSVVGMHFFNPAPVMKLVEVVGTVLTAPDALATAHRVCADLGKHPVACADRAGFIVNALLFPYLNDAVRLLEEHRAPAEDIDTVMAQGCGYPLGPLALHDVIGLDVSLQIQRSLHAAFHEESLAPAAHLEHLVGAGYLGRKTGRGFRSH
ncbi:MULTISPECIES: 3-hydroxyacyl-CoA dehydrogenase family protein [Streptomyces]|uniref:3-Hydroxybutyryl-CoA dehydrogenase n=2 Tax=Streptomyces albus subsp. albus TaxID=67257 RepID=H6D567_STRA4|nr:3-hydroxyacyl-CoA dehydrogenase NAD-binding domain-containing protein [Streptomyces sp. SCSIO ZS0520]AEZ53943.1 putative 3-hydroxybutyryl-CoA dehydrogenase [Streptomyces albus]CCD31888.1 3-hydroxyacyl-CoA dehydrogenase [Streptomyces albus subsp. albus]AJE80658.1 3-Hydroxybutyryl-CoA dehydrogenase [Streptomyces albus]AOU74969.1 3-Hydroxybutyryl-CoA dehydrogenase [Streptomyces albus]AYN30778.1 3-hydroxybutyryl-CoA dehydrogenase [Streptomyces albus]